MGGWGAYCQNIMVFEAFCKQPHFLIFWVVTYGSFDHMCHWMGSVFPFKSGIGSQLCQNSIIILFCTERDKNLILKVKFH